VVFSHGLLMSADMFRELVRSLSPRYRVVAYDHRGQGRSELTSQGLDMDTLAADAAALIETLGLAPCHFAGLSMGGFVAMRLAARRPELLRSCILLETSADPEPPENASRYRMMSWAVRLLGVRPVIDKVMPILFGKTFLADPACAELRAEWRSRLLALRRSIHRAVAGVVERGGVHQELGKISMPTLVLVGEEDVATPPAKAERIQAAVRGSRLVRIPRAGHSSTIENPAAVNAALAGFLSSR
jgi:pimeloyl-ACP methyl ester carboxylesterase